MWIDRACNANQCTSLDKINTKGTVTNRCCVTVTTLPTLPLDGFVKVYHEPHIDKTIPWPLSYGFKDMTF